MAQVLGLLALGVSLSVCLGIVLNALWLGPRAENRRLRKRLVEMSREDLS